VEEAQAVTKKSWDVLVPTIRKEGSEIWLSFNPELDTDETYQRFIVHPPADSFVVNIGWRDNPWFPETLRKEKDALEARDKEAYENVWEGKPRTVVEGAIYRTEVVELYEQRRARNVPYDPMLKVHAVWDLGWNDQTSIILVQRKLSEVGIIDYIEDSHRTLADYAAELRNKPYNWGADWLPHDGEAKDYKTGRSAQEILQQLGRKVRIVPKLDVESGIKAARLMFPRCYFDAERCRRLLDCLKRYRRAINQNTNEPVAPLHDEHSHGADAFRYLGVIVDKLFNDDINRSGPLKYANQGIV
jgi:phage terminase large subunit